MRPGPECSIVIPARNAMAWLAPAIASIGADLPVEILVVDDGSTDGTAELLNLLARRDARIVPLTGPQRGFGAALNAALAVAAAPLVAFLGAGDRWCPDKLEMQLSLHLVRPDIGFSFTDWRELSCTGTGTGTCTGPDAGLAGYAGFAERHGARRECFTLGRDALAQVFAEALVVTSTVMARTQLLRQLHGFDESFGEAAAWDLWLRLAARAPVGCVPLVATLAEARPAAPAPDHELAARRRVAARHGRAVSGQDAAARQRGTLRLLEAEAAAAGATGRPWRAVAKRAALLLRAPGRQAARAAGASLLRAACGPIARQGWPAEAKALPASP